VGTNGTDTEHAEILITHEKYTLQQHFSSGYQPRPLAGTCKRSLWVPRYPQQPHHAIPLSISVALTNRPQNPLFCMHMMYLHSPVPDLPLLCYLFGGLAACTEPQPRPCLPKQARPLPGTGSALWFAPGEKCTKQVIWGMERRGEHPSNADSTNIRCMGDREAG